MKDLHTLEFKISWFLRIGVIIAGILMTIGICWSFKLSGDSFFNFQTYDQIPLYLSLELHLKHGHWGQIISYAGLITLISLPILRVLLTALLFFIQKEFIIAMIAISVFIGLLVSFSLGIIH